MTKEIAKKEEEKPIRKFTKEDAKTLVFDCAEETLGINAALEKFASKNMGKFKALSEAEKQKMNEEMTALSFRFGIETGHTLSSCVSNTFQGLALQMKRGLETEFECKSYSEKALVDLAVNAYIRVMRYSWKMDGNQEYIGQKYDGYRNYLSHEIDRAHRHYISAIETLKCMKQPTMNVSIKTNTAFVGEKQQFNTKVESNEAK